VKLLIEVIALIIEIQDTRVMNEERNDPLIKDRLLRTTRLICKGHEKNLPDSLGVIGDRDETDARKARETPATDVLGPTYLQTIMRDSTRGSRTVAMCSGSGVSSMTARQYNRSSS
jgi:hypothetical protein